MQNESHIDSYDVAIIGAGLVGLTLANLLRKYLRDRRIAVVEPRSLTLTNPNTSLPDCVEQFQLRVSAITPASEYLFERLGVWQELQRVATPFREMEVRESDGTGGVELESRSAGEARLGHIIENSVIENALFRAAKVDCEEITSEITWFSPVSLERAVYSDNGGMNLVLSNGQQVHTKLLIAADGARSPTRDLMEMPMVEWDYNATSIVTTVKTERPHEGVARQMFTPYGPLAFLPLGIDPHSRYVSIVWSQRTELAQRSMLLSDQEFLRELDSAAEHWLGESESVAVRQAIPLYPRHAKRYVKEGFALVGDAAHVIHPLAGQGVNLGLMDVAVLTEELISAEKRGIDMGGLLQLRRYERRRKGANITMAAGMEFFKRIYEADHIHLRLVRNLGMKWVNQTGLIKGRLMDFAMGRVGDIPELMQKQPLI